MVIPDHLSPARDFSHVARSRNHFLAGRVNDIAPADAADSRIVEVEAHSLEPVAPRNGVVIGERDDIARCRVYSFRHRRDDTSLIHGYLRKPIVAGGTQESRRFVIGHTADNYDLPSGETLGPQALKADPQLLGSTIRGHDDGHVGHARPVARAHATIVLRATLAAPGR